MPLFNFDCKSCGKTSEIFVRNKNQKIVCECGSEDLTKIYDFTSENRIWKDAKDSLNEVNKEVDKMCEKLNKSDDKTFLDLYGE